MGPLVYYSRWRGAKLRLRGRDDHHVWGQFAIPGAEGEQVENFRFDTQTWELILGDGDAQKRLQLDDLGVVLPSDE